MKIAVFGRPNPILDSSGIKELLSLLLEMKFSVVVYKPFISPELINSLKNKFFETFISNSDLPENIDFMISVGGDGTFLDAVRVVSDKNIPIIGINTGRLGFLSSVSFENIKDALIKLSAGQYKIKERTLLSCNYSGFGDLNFGLNDFTIHKKDTSSMITIHTWLDGEFLNSYWADGLIIATPTGSTAYSLSCGGPIIDPEAENFIITPIAPHNLTVRPMVVSDKTTIRIRPEGRSTSYLISIDGHTDSIESDTEIEISLAPFKVKIIVFDGDDFYSTLRNKLMWGIDKRN